MPPPSPQPPTIRLPWVEPLVPPRGRSLPQHGLLIYDPPVGPPRLPGSPPARHLTTGANRELWEMMIPSLRDVPDAVSVALGYTNERIQPVPVRLHDLAQTLAPIRDPTGTSESSAIARVAAPSIPLRWHPSLRDAIRTGTAILQALDNMANRDTGVQVYPNGYTPILCGLETNVQFRRVHGHWSKPNQIFWPGGMPRPAPNAHYVGFEFEAEFPDRNMRIDEIVGSLFYASDSLSIGPVLAPEHQSGYLRMNREPHLHVETDGTIQSGYEIVTMPHRLGHPSTYTAMETIFGTIMNLGGHNQPNTCGMHMHMSKSILRWPDRTLQELVYDVVDRFDALLLKYVKNNSSYYYHFTGRVVPPDGMAVVSFNRDNERYRHINWRNQQTLEFRWPGPHRFSDARWPNVIMDVCHAIVRCALTLVSQLRAPGRSLSAQRITTPGYSYVRADAIWAMRMLQRIICDSPDEFPYAYHHFFQSPLVPDGFVII